MKTEIPLLDESAFGELKRRQKTQKPLAVVGFDSEDDTRGVPLMFTFHDGEKGYVFRRAAHAIRFILEYPAPAVFVAHNLEYDIGNLFKATNFREVDKMIYAMRLLRVSLKFTNNFLLNSLSFFPGNLKAMGEVVGLPKLEGKALDAEYAMRDAHIVQRFMSRFQDRLLNDFGAPLGVSIGQVSMDIYRRAFLPFAKLKSYNHPRALSAFYGGRVEMFYKGLCEEPVHVVDFNSCYPYVMREREYPDTSTLRLTSISKDTFGIGKFSMFVPKDLFVPPLPWRSPAGRLFFPTGLFTGWWTFAEVRKAVSMGCKIMREWESVGTSDALKPFDDFVNHFYGLREVAKRKKKSDPNDENAKFDDAYYKLLMNNCYGKLIMHKPGNTLTRTRLSDRFLEENPHATVIKHGPFYSYTVPREKAPPSANYMWGLYVTSYSRLHLLETLLKVHESGARLLYCDTDSVMFTGSLPDSIPISSTLGECSHEVFDLGVFRQSKGYLLCNFSDDKKTASVEKVACKGVSTAYSLDFIVKGTAYVLKPMRLKEALIRTSVHANVGAPSGRLGRELGINVWDEVRRTMKGIYIKRKGNFGVTAPVNVDEIRALEEDAFMKEAVSMEDELSHLNLQPLETPSTAFLDIKIPPKWFDEDTLPPLRLPDSDKQHILSLRECEGLSIGEVFVSGTILGKIKGKYSEFFKIRLKEYLDAPVMSENLVALLPVKAVFGSDPEKDLTQNFVTLYLADDYILKRAIKFRVECSPPSLASRVSVQNPTT